MDRKPVCRNYQLFGVREPEARGDRIERASRGCLARTIPHSLPLKILLPFLLILLPGFLPVTPYRLHPRAAAAETTLPPNSIQIPADIPALLPEGGFITIPILFRHDGKSDTLSFGLDYDELLLQFANGWLFEGTAGEDILELRHDPVNGIIHAVVRFDPGRAVDRTEKLIWLQFEVKSWFLDQSYGYRQSVSFDLLEKETWFMSGAAGGERIAPAQVLDGSVTFYLRNMVELGSAQFTPDRQRFTIPVYVTHVRSEPLLFAMGLDYDEMFLSLLNITSPLGQDALGIQWTEDSGEDPARIVVRFHSGMFPEMLRTHLLDLHFEYDPTHGTPPDDTLTLHPILGLEQGEAGNAIPLADDSLGTVAVDGHLYLIPRPFLRGDVDDSRIADVGDALAILSANYMGSFHFGCLESADLDDNGTVDMSDAVYLLQYIYRGGPPPAAPFPEVGFDPPGSPSLGCEHYGVPFFEELPLPESF